MTHLERCREDVANYARGLADRVRSGKLNIDRVETLIDAYLDQAAFYPHDRADLKRRAMWWF